MHRARLLELPEIVEQRGNLAFLEASTQLPFEICRVCWLYDMSPTDAPMAHACRNTEEIVFALSGSFTAVLNDGKQEQRFGLTHPHIGLYVPPMLWRELRDFT